MNVIERVEIGSKRAYVTDEKAVYESDGRNQSERILIPVSNVSGVKIKEAGNAWILVLGIFFGWMCAAGIVSLGVLDSPETWLTISAIASAVLAGILLTVYLLTKVVSVEVLAPGVSFKITGTGSSSESLKTLAKTIVAVSEEQGRTSSKTSLEDASKT